MTEDSALLRGFEPDAAVDMTRDRWMQAQRDLITTTLDYNLATIATLVQERRIDLNPSFQRRERWDVLRRSRLIESFMMNVPLPPVFLNEDEYGQYSIIDGKQRVTTVADFLSDEFALSGLTVFQEANGLRFSQLDYSLQSVLLTRASLRAIILLRLSDPLIKYQVFQRLNTGGVRLNAQEVRNVTFSGGLNDTLIELSQEVVFRRAIGIDPAAPSRSALFREMRDVELVLRYFTLRDGVDRFAGSLGGAMNSFMEEHLKADRSTLGNLASDFRETLDKVLGAFGTGAFRRWSPKSELFGKQILATLFDAQMLAVTGHDLTLLKSHTLVIQERMIKLFSQTEFTKSIGAQTNTPAFVRTRVEVVQDLIDRCLSGS